MLGHRDVLHLVFSKLARRDKLLSIDLIICFRQLLACTKFSDPCNGFCMESLVPLFSTVCQNDLRRNLRKKSFGKVWCIYQSCPISWRWELQQQIQDSSFLMTRPLITGTCRLCRVTHHSSRFPQTFRFGLRLVKNLYSVLATEFFV